MFDHNKMLNQKQIENFLNIVSVANHIRRGELFIDANGKLEFVNREPVIFQYPIAQIFEEVFTKAEEIENKDMTVFITSNGRKITRSRLSYSFARASKKAGIRKVFPDIIRIVNDEE